MHNGCRDCTAQSRQKSLTRTKTETLQPELAIFKPEPEVKGNYPYLKTVMKNSLQLYLQYQFNLFLDKNEQIYTHLYSNI